MIRKLILGTASVLALGIGGAALDFSADADDVAHEQLEPSHHWLNAANPSKDDIRWAQVELHMIGLYDGSLDGIAGPETRQALLRFQTSNGLERTATLDQQTADALTGDIGVWSGIKHAAAPGRSRIDDEFFRHQRFWRQHAAKVEQACRRSPRGPWGGQTNVRESMETPTKYREEAKDCRELLSRPVKPELRVQLRLWAAELDDMADAVERGAEAAARKEVARPF
jgi:hypothetical protein